jgi:hypothetical protein
MATSRPTALPVARVQGEDSRSPLFGADHVSGLGLGKPASDTPAREGKMVNRPVFAPETQEQTVSTRGERDKRALNSLSFWLEHPLGKGEVVSSILPGSTTESVIQLRTVFRRPENRASRHKFLIHPVIVVAELKLDGVTCGKCLISRRRAGSALGATAATYSGCSGAALLDRLPQKPATQRGVDVLPSYGSCGFLPGVAVGGAP